MKLNRSKANEDEKPRVLHAMEFCELFGQCLEGFPFNDELAGPDGIHLQLLVPPGVDDSECENALELGYSQQDVVSHSVLECPDEWFAQANFILNRKKKSYMANYCVQDTYTHEISGNFISIEISRHIERQKLNHLELNTIWWGSWETPANERVRGFSLRAVSKDNPHSKHVESFNRDNMTDDEIRGISLGLANYLGVPLHVDGKVFNCCRGQSRSTKNSF